MAKALTTRQIMDILPHRSPFLLVDAIEDYEEGVYAIGRKCITYDEPYFQGHFPEMPIMPGVLQVEALAQTGAVAILCKEEFKGRIAVFAGIDKCKFKRPVVPGDVLTLKTEITALRGPVGMGHGVAMVGDEVACDCIIKFAILPNQEDGTSEENEG
ncbi:MAG: 3-hydroxyacyl-ACP dehydratase FabZ [Clostridiales bacterium]|nr:3-hydroxyacyl-ACP dehydratase FabZ [Clostridiales bacterium]